MKFPYVKVPREDPREKWVSRPLIPIFLFGPKSKILTYALIDSGADLSLFSAELAKEIGLDLEKGIKTLFSGIEGGQVVAYLHKIKVQIMGMTEMLEIFAGFTYAKGVTAILGQEGFFDAFKIKFDRRHNTIEINPIPDSHFLKKNSK